MGHKHDYWESVRAFIIPKLAILIGIINKYLGTSYYVESVTGSKQYVGRVYMDVEGFEKELHDMGFERNPLASYKTLFGSNKSEVGSWRLVDGDYQLHTILYVENNYVKIYSHYEYRWDKHPIKHYRGKKIDIHKGVEMMHRKLSEHGIEVEQ